MAIKKRMIIAMDYFSYYNFVILIIKNLSYFAFFLYF